MPWMKTSNTMPVYVYAVHKCSPTYESMFMSADTFVVEMQTVVMQICENGKMLRGSSIYAILL